MVGRDGQPGQSAETIVLTLEKDPVTSLNLLMEDVHVKDEISTSVIAQAVYATVS